MPHAMLRFAVPLARQCSFGSPSLHIVAFAGYAYYPPILEMQLEVIEEHLQRGDDVTVLVCEGELAACDINPQHFADRCLHCRGRSRAGLRLLSAGARVESFERLTAADRAERDRLQTEFESVEALKAYRIGNFDIGYAVLSSVVTYLREPDLDLQVHGDLIKRFMHAAWTVYRSMQHLLTQRPVDQVYVPIGRVAPLRGVLRACQEQNVECLIQQLGKDHEHYALFRNALFHDRQNTERLIREAWETAASPQREEIAADWYRRRAGGYLPNLKEAFVAGQTPGQLPPDWNPARRNVALFTSSEDEFAAIGDMWHNPLYDTQMDGLRAIVDSLRDDPGDLHLYVRVHPRKGEKIDRRTAELLRWDEPFVTVIGPREPISSYALMQAAEQVLTFGSSVGMEAVFWGKPSILAGMCFYRDLGGTYVPRSHAELINLLRQELAPQDVEPALVYGYYLATFGVPFRHWQPSGLKNGSFKGRPIRVDLPTRAGVLLHRGLRWLQSRP